MIIKPVFERLNQRAIEALMLHSQLADYFGYLGLNAFKKMHEKQFFEEAEDRMKMKCFYMQMTDTVLEDAPVTKDIKLIPHDWTQSSRCDISASVKTRAVLEGFQKYMEWEKETREILQDCAKQLHNDGDMCAYDFVICMAKKQSEELAEIKDIMVKLKAVDYDMAAIMDMQHEGS